MQRKLLLLSLKRLALLPKSSKKAIIREFRQKQKPQTAYVRQVHRASCGFFLVTSSSGVPAGYCVPVGLMVTF